MASGTVSSNSSSYYFNNTTGTNGSPNWYIGTPSKKMARSSIYSVGSSPLPSGKKPLADTVKILSLDPKKTTKKILREATPKRIYLELHNDKKINQVEPSKQLRTELYNNLRSTEIFRFLEEWVQQEMFADASIVFSGDYLLWATGLIPKQQTPTIQLVTKGVGLDSQSLKNMLLEDFGSKLCNKDPDRFSGHAHINNLTNTNGLLLYDDDTRIKVELLTPSSLRTILQNRMKLLNRTKRIMYDPVYKLLFMGKTLSTCFQIKKHSDRPSTLAQIIQTVKECKDYDLDLSDNTLFNILTVLPKLRIDDTYISSAHRYSTPLAFVLAPFLAEQARTPELKAKLKTTLATIARYVINKSPIRNDYDWLQPNRTIKRFGLDIYGATWRRDVSEYSDEVIQTDPVLMQEATLNDAFRLLS